MLALADFVCGANEKDMHLTGVNWERDLAAPTAADFRNVVEGDLSPSGNGKLRMARGIEVGHIFQLGRKYSEPMKATVLDESGKETALLMGCYGIGVTRVVAAAIEQNHDDRGIIWPIPLAPFQVVLVPLNLQKAIRVRELTDRQYADFAAAGIEVLRISLNTAVGAMPRAPNSRWRRRWHSSVRESADHCSVQIAGICQWPAASRISQ